MHSEPLWLIDRIADLLDEHAQQAPILIAIDDYQWADPLGHFALRALAGRMVGLPVVWLLASRGADPVRHLTSLRKPRLCSVALRAGEIVAWRESRRCAHRVPAGHGRRLVGRGRGRR